jgi:serine phosphatase RsbU (regulator of sigma subunit)
VSDVRRRGLDLGRLLRAVEDAAPVAATDVFGEFLAEMLGASEVAFLIADLSGDALVRMGHAGSSAGTRTQGRETADRVPLVGTVHGRVLVNQAVEVEDGGDSWWVFAPVTNRGDAIGLLELELPDAPDAQVLADVAFAAHLLAYVVVANRQFTDLFEWGQRSVPLSLPAEIQHRLLPSAFTCEAGQFTVAGWMEPAGSVAGDTFDFSLDRDHLHLSITDAMGHEINAAVLATVLVGALRNARRAGADLREQARFANAGLAAHFADGEFVTGQLVRVDIRSGTASVINAGHPPPLRLRAGGVTPVALEAEFPFAIESEHEYREQTLALESGDRLLFVTDGMLDRNANSVDIAALIAQAADLHPREAVQHLIRAVVDAAGGELQDDATVMCLDWHGGPPGSRTSDSGADR